MSLFQFSIRYFVCLKCVCTVRITVPHGGEEFNTAKGNKHRLRASKKAHETKEADKIMIQMKSHYASHTFSFSHISGNMVKNECRLYTSGSASVDVNPSSLKVSVMFATGLKKAIECVHLSDSNILRYSKCSKSA